MSAPADTLSIDDLEGMEGVVKFDMDQKIFSGAELLNVLVEAKIFPSKGEARKMIQQGGLSINRNKISDPAFRLGTELLLHNKYVLIQKGKKHHYLLRTV